MMRLWGFAACAAAVASASCDSEVGHLDACGTPPAPLVGCDPEPIETPEDACWKLVTCGSILLREPEGEDPYTWGDCVNQLSRRDSGELEFILRCVETSTCDELVPTYYPETDFYGVVCFAFGRS